MKKYFGSVFLITVLLSCGGESSTVEANEGESSIVATTNPVQGEVINPNSGNANPITVSSAQGTTTIEYIEREFAFGNVTYPSENLHTFKFKNTGDVPLIIESATASCGCTVPNKPEEPIMPGEIGEMDVIFRPKEGQQGQLVTKKVTVTANTEPKQTYLQISGNVMAAMLDK